MSTSTWVPLVTAAVGLAAGVATGLVSTVLARRWSSQDRQVAWQREDSLRWRQDRLVAMTAVPPGRPVPPRKRTSYALPAAGGRSERPRVTISPLPRPA
jgi:hypothetical protein